MIKPANQLFIFEPLPSERDLFNEFRKQYPGTKRGNEIEFESFAKKHKDWKLVLPQLGTYLKRQIALHKKRKDAGQWVPEWQNLKTYLFQRSWERDNDDEEQIVKPKAHVKTQQQKHEEMLRERKRINDNLRAEGKKPFFSEAQLNEPFVLPKDVISFTLKEQND